MSPWLLAPNLSIRWAPLHCPHSAAALRRPAGQQARDSGGQAEQAMVQALLDRQLRGGPASR